MQLIRVLIWRLGNYLFIRGLPACPVAPEDDTGVGQLIVLGLNLKAI